MDNEYENRSWYDEVRVTQRGLSLPAEQCSAVLSGLCNYDYASMCVRTYFSVACSVTSTLTSVAHVRRVRVRKYCN